METIIAYFETIPSLHRSLILVGGLSFFWLLEGKISLFEFKYKKWKHAIPNLFFTLTTIIINFLLAFLLLNTSDWVNTNNFGIIHWIPTVSLWVEVFLGVLFLDLVGAYAPHWVEHKVKRLWMIHLVHHSDHHVDTTTANRHHPLESFVRFGFTLLGVFIFGANIGIIMLYQSLSLIATQFNHANIKLPKKLDLFLSYFIVSPDMHKTHHHYRLPYTDANYGNIFSIWDRLFGTYLPFDREKLVYGVDVFFDKEANGKIGKLLKQPLLYYSKPTLTPKKEL
jgi:sterol desaturase/sphingolipid hydroxylase (fatty acid hydroxylase superfamily)